MTNLSNLKRQHIEIIDNVKIITKLIHDKNFENNSNDIARNISILAGKLKIHLSSEDKFLYPNLLNHNHTEIRKKANQYVDEMGNLTVIFTDYKNKFNTKSKIMNNIDQFIKESKSIFNAIEKRIHKEDKELYVLLDNN